MGNTQSADGDGNARRHSGHQGNAAASDGASMTSQPPSHGGGISHRLSRRSKPASAAVPVPTAHTPMDTNGGMGGVHQQLRNHHRHPPGVGPVDMLSPVVGSPLPDSSLAQGYGNIAAGRFQGGAGAAHMAVPESIPQTLPNQGGLAQMMAARKIGSGAGGRSPLTGISDDRIRSIVESAASGGRVGFHGRRTSGLANTFSPGDDNAEVAKAVPTLIRWTEQGSTVYISGSFIDWQYKIKLHENDGMFGVVIDLPVGTHCLKFIVDGKWRCSNRFIIAPDDDGNLVNYFKVEDVVEEQDQEKEDNVEGLDAATMSNSPPGEYGTAIPDLAKLAREASSSRRNEPPLLPPHLNQVLLNSSEIRRDDPSVLPVPNHVVLNHLYACSIKDNVMAVSSTSRYRGKYMTTVYYKPVTPLN
ncbi:hypothetical protein H4218_001553 [Coemansia sp. IMI 209128]|nr:hypothetical protein GGI10_004515 [Coemansia sp. RSA 2530]KAJ2701260.1 hypothetical protein H4218_001553 [Coemansia sp. IMI 209128]